MITFDGDRSRKLKWAADKQLRVLKDLDLSAKALTIDGFLVRVSNTNGIAKGRITAPMGLGVTCSNKDGIQVAIADFWAGAFKSKTDLHVLHYETASNQMLEILFHKISTEDMQSYGYQTIKFRPMQGLSSADFPMGSAPSPGDTQYLDHSAKPVLQPYKGGEAFWVSVTDNIFLDLNDNGLADYPKYISETALTFYSSNNASEGRLGLGIQRGGTITPGYMAMQQLSPYKIVYWSFVARPDGYYLDGTEKLITRDITLPDESLNPVEGRIPNFESSYLYLSDLIPIGSMPTALRNILLDTGDIDIGPISTFNFELDGVRSTLHVVDATTLGAYWTSPSDVRDYFSANPSDEPWKLFYTLRVDETAYCISSSQFISLLDSLATVEIIRGDLSINYFNALNMLSQICQAPDTMHAFSIPTDNHMFHGSDSNIYTWTREYGAIRFTPTGIEDATSYLSVPTEVSSEDGVRPLITHAQDDFYACVCIKKQPVLDPTYIYNGIFTPPTEVPADPPTPLSYSISEVKAIYIGGLLTWTKLPDLTEVDDETLTLIDVRVIKATEEEAIVLGIVKREHLVDEETLFEYRFAFLSWTLENSGEWKLLGTLPFEVSHADNFSMCLFGIGPFVGDQTLYNTQPVCAAKQPVCPYDDYIIGMP